MIKLSSTKLIQYLNSVPTEKAIAVAEKLKAAGYLPHNKKIRKLGQGIEGVADLVTDAKHGVAVKKYFNLKSPYYTNSRIRRKIEIFKNPELEGLLAKYYGTEGKHPILKTEFINPKKIDWKTNYKFRNNKENIKKFKKWSINDLSGDNILIDKNNKPKIIDFMTEGHKDKVINAYRTRHVLKNLSKKDRTTYLNYLRNKNSGKNPEKISDKLRNSIEHLQVDAIVKQLPKDNPKLFKYYKNHTDLNPGKYHSNFILDSDLIRKKALNTTIKHYD